jgi:hypothetical protein
MAGAAQLETRKRTALSFISATAKRGEKRIKLQNG